MSDIDQAIENYKSNEIAKVESKFKNSPLKDEMLAEKKEYLANTEFKILDNKNLICTSITEHLWIYDEPNHKVCKRCGYGSFI